jgi:hypothetical protein
MRAARLVAVSLCLCAAHVARAQTPTPTPIERREATPADATATPAPTPSEAAGATNEPDLSITGSVTARELRFEVVPTPKVEFPGRPRRDTVWEAERTNLPAEVQPGVTYRDIGIRLKITSVFADIERIVAEALGEIPTSDDAPPKPGANENTQPPPGSAQAAPADTQPTSDDAARTHDASPATSATQTSVAPAAARRRRP